MRTRNEMSPAFERLVSPQTRRPDSETLPESEHGLEVLVVFTSVDATLSALKKAAELAASLGARITLIVPQIVPYPLPLNSPPVLIDFNERRFQVIASQIPVETIVRIYLCRDRSDALNMVMKPRSLVVVGARKRFWPTAEARLARKLRRAGHEVIVTEVE